MNQISPERLREIYDRCGGDAALIGKELGISHLELANQVIPPNLMPSRIRKPPTNVGVDYFRQYIVSIKHADHSTWPQADFQAIEEARSKYEAGTHTMTQARDRDWFVLYCVPLKQRVGARKFFRTFV